MRNFLENLLVGSVFALLMSAGLYFVFGVESALGHIIGAGAVGVVSVIGKSFAMGFFPVEPTSGPLSVSYTLLALLGLWAGGYLAIYSQPPALRFAGGAVIVISLAIATYGGERKQWI